MNIAEKFQALYGGAPTWIAHAPGRINLIGEHTDYHEGWVFPAAIDLGVTVAARPTTGASRLVSEGHGNSGPIRLGDPVPVHSWLAYATGTAVLLGDVPPLEILAISDLPVGAGLSSSAATEVAHYLIFAAAKGETPDPIEAARLCQRAENEVAGVPCGLMDQLASLTGVEGHALLLDMRYPERGEAVPIPEHLVIVALNSGEQHQLGDSGYPLRRRQSEAGAALFGAAVLRDVTIEQVESIEDPLIRRRSRHVVTENARCRAMARALAANNLEAIGDLMRASHASMRDDYEITTPLLDEIAAWADQQTACVGARMTGGGFGGSCVALVEREAAEPFCQAFAERFGRGARIIRPSTGARLL